MNKDKDKNTKIIGIDPGTNVLGYSVIEVFNKSDIKLHSLGVIQLDQFTDHYIKLQKIFEKLSFVLKMYEPHEMAIEAPFFGKNAQSMLKLGRAQGVAIAAGMMQGLEVIEYSPRKIKQAITGNGNATKNQVSMMLQKMLKLDTMPKYFDATDALGVAVCHNLQRTSVLYKMGGSKAKNWKDFIKNNPDKIKR